MKGKKLAALALVGALSISVLSACGDPDVEGYEAQIAALKSQNEALTAQVANSTITEQSADTSLRVIDGTSRALFGTVEGQLKFPNELKIPNSSVDSNDSRIQVGSKFTFAGTGEWQFKFDGTKLNLQHPQKIWGQIKSVAIQNVDTVNGVKAILQSFYKGFPATNITYQNVFIGSNLSGILSQAAINVDRKDYQVITGVIESRDTALLVLFVYKDEGNGVQRELINSYLSTGMYQRDMFTLD